MPIPSVVKPNDIFAGTRTLRRAQGKGVLEKRLSLTFQNQIDTWIVLGSSLNSLTVPLAVRASAIPATSVAATAVLAISPRTIASYPVCSTAIRGLCFGGTFGTPRRTTYLIRIHGKSDLKTR